MVYIANFLGAMTIVALIYFAGTWHNAKGGWGKVVLDVSTAKLHHGLLEAFALGILCNLTVCLAVWAAYSGRSTTDKILAVTMPIALFVATGFEHSVANMFLIPLGIIISDTAGPGFWAEAGIEASAYSGLTWLGFLLDNLLPVTLGNIVGGGLMIGIMYWTIFRRAERPAKPAAAPPS